jgi:hypothetical protein
LAIPLTRKTPAAYESPSIRIDGIMNRYVDCVEVNFEGNYFISISMDTSNAILINKVRKCFCKIGLNFPLKELGDELLETHTSIPPYSLTAMLQVTTATMIFTMVRTVTGTASWAEQFIRQRDGKVDQNQQGRFYLYRGHVDA